MFFIHFDLFEKHLTGENMQKKLVVRTMIAAVAFALAGGAFAAGGSSGPAVKYPKQGQIGEIITNPYRIAPLTAMADTNLKMFPFASYRKRTVRKSATRSPLKKL